MWIINEIHTVSSDFNNRGGTVLDSGAQEVLDQILCAPAGPNPANLRRERVTEVYPLGDGEFGRPMNAVVQGDDNFLKTYSRACDHAKTT